jgi:nitrate/nitrite-specific signal transduction histidine kinase
MTATITKKVGFLLALMTGAALLVLAVFHWFLHETAAEGATINVAARQLMLAQQIEALSRRAAAGTEAERTALATIAGEFDRALEALERGGRALGRELPPAEGPVRDEIRRLRRLWVEAQPALPGARAPAAPASPAAPVEAERLVALLPAATDRIVLAIEEHGRLLRRRMFYVLTGVAAFDLGVLLVGLWLTARYLTRPVRLLEAGVRRVERGELDQPVPIVTRDELAIVTAAFNEMSSTLARLLEERARR